MLTLTRFKKLDLDPNSPPPVELHYTPHFDLLYTMTLAAFKVFGGPSTFTFSTLRRSYHANPYLGRMLLREKKIEISRANHAAAALAQEAVLYLYRFRRIWMNVPGPEDWIKASEEDVKKAAL
jgi:hypothetical protein